MGGSNAPTAASASVGGMRKVIARLKPADSGEFFGHDGKKYPW